MSNGLKKSVNMCLKLDKSKYPLPLLATEDLIVYKLVLAYHKNFNEYEKIKYCTPYYGSDVEIGCTYTSEFSFNGRGDVEKGLHSYCNLQDVQGIRSEFERIIKCLIPKGSRYFRGSFGKYESLASDQLTYLELIN